MLGSSVSFVVSSSSRYAPQLISRLGASETGGTKLGSGPLGFSPLSSVNTGDAVGNILAIVANMKASKGPQTAQNVQGSDNVGASVSAAISAYLSESDHTSDDARVVLGQHMDQLMKKAPDSHRGLAEAYKNGTLNIERLWDMGVETSRTVTLQFDESGRQGGSAFKYHGNDNAIDFLKAKMDWSEGQSLVWGTDKETGMNASWMAIGNNYFYLTW